MLLLQQLLLLLLLLEQLLLLLNQLLLRLGLLRMSWLGRRCTLGLAGRLVVVMVVAVVMVRLLLVRRGLLLLLLLLLVRLRLRQRRYLGALKPLLPTQVAAVLEHAARFRMQGPKTPLAGLVGRSGNLHETIVKT